VRQRIKRIYDRESEVVHPPVDTSRFSVSAKDEGYFLVVSALVPYKRLDIAVDACTKLGEKLVVVGSGGEEKTLKARAGNNVKFIGRANDDEVKRYYEGCKALLFPGEEDFGIVPVEAMACGKPVIAFGKGGALETVIEGRTGILFPEQNVESLIEAIRPFQSTVFDFNLIRSHALQFDREIFKQKIADRIFNAAKALRH